MRSLRCNPLRSPRLSPAFAGPAVGFAATMVLLSVGLMACQSAPPPPASETIKIFSEASDSGMARGRRLNIDGIVDGREWADPDSLLIPLPDGRAITVLYQRGPESLDFAFLGLGEQVSEPIHPEILLDVSGEFPLRFGRDSWIFKIAPARCAARASLQEDDCSPLFENWRASPPPARREDNLEVQIGFTLLEFDPAKIREIAFALRFADERDFEAAIWPSQAERERPDTWSVLDLGS